MLKTVFHFGVWCFGVTALAQGPAHVDWYQAYQNKLNVNNSRYPAPNRPDLSLELHYAYARYIMDGYLFMYQKTGNTAYLNYFIAKADTFFSPVYFRDYMYDDPNGYNDGYRGWGSAEPFMMDKALPVNIQQSTWYAMKLQVKDTTVDGLVLTQARVWLNSSLVYQDQYYPSRSSVTVGALPQGTIALLSGWSHTVFRNIKVVDLNSASVFYELDSSLSTFETDWTQVRGSDPNDTGDWLLNANGSDATISCDATSNPSYYTVPGGRGAGKYAALVLTKPGSLSLTNYEVASAGSSCRVSLGVATNLSWWSHRHSSTITQAWSTVLLPAWLPRIRNVRNYELTG